MKKTLFVTMLAAALLGGQVFADPTGTAIEGYDEEHSYGSYYYGKYSETESVTGGSVTIKADPSGEVPSDATVYGGFSNAGSASNSKVTMTGGEVYNVCGGCGSDSACGNTVVITCGKCETIYGGAADQGETNNNVVIVSGNVMISEINGGYTVNGAIDNSVHLVGKGVTNVAIKDAQGETGYYNGGNGIEVTSLYGAYTYDEQAATGNSINIYGTGITVALELSSMQILTFNVTNAQMTEQTPEAALTHTASATDDWARLNLEGVELQVNDLDVASWTPGTTITLVQSTQAIQGLSDPKEVNIMRGDQVMAVGTLALAGDGKLLQLTIPGSVPEPTTGTLSLLALAGLCVRRRRK